MKKKLIIIAIFIVIVIIGFIIYKSYTKYDYKSTFCSSSYDCTCPEDKDYCTCKYCIEEKRKEDGEVECIKFKTIKCNNSHKSH